MSVKITNEQGQEEEVYTASELETQRQTAVKEYQDKNPDKTEELGKLEDKLKDATEKLDKLQDKDMNFGELRKQKEAAEKAVKDLKVEIDEKVGAAEKKILEGVMKDHYTDTLNSLASGDEELKKKIEFQYKRLQDSASTKDEVTKKMTDAYVLATGKRVDEGVLNSGILSSGNSKLNIKSGSQSFSQEEKDLARKLAQSGGITLKDEDFK